MKKYEKSIEKNKVAGQKQKVERRRREVQSTMKKKPRPCEMGTAFHGEEAKNIQAKEAAIGKKEAKRQGDKRGDFDVEKTLKHRDGRNVRLDHVDYNTGTITDHKQIAHNENLEKFVAKTKPQRIRHTDAYEHNREQKKLPEHAKESRKYIYNNLYGSSKDKVGDMPNVKEVTIKQDKKGNETAEADILRDGPLMTKLQKIERRKREAYNQRGLHDVEKKKRLFESQQAE